MDDFSDLPMRYRTMPPGELLTEDRARRMSLTATFVTVAIGAGLLYLFWSTEREDAPRRRAKLERARAELRRQRRQAP